MTVIARDYAKEARVHTYPPFVFTRTATGWLFDPIDMRNVKAVTFQVTLIEYTGTLKYEISIENSFDGKVFHYDAGRKQVLSRAGTSTRPFTFYMYSTLAAPFRLLSAVPKSGNGGSGIIEVQAYFGGLEL